jgi:protein TonB
MAQLHRARPAGTGETGRVVVRFVIQRSGAATAIALAHPSGVSAIDQAALAMVRRASPFPPLPAEFAPASMSLSLPIHFR